MTDNSSSFGFLVNQTKQMVEQPCNCNILVSYVFNANKVYNTSFAVLFTHLFKIENNAIVAQLEHFLTFFSDLLMS